MPNGIKDLKSVESGDPKRKKQTIATEKHVAGTIAQIPLKATAHCRRLPDAVFAAPKLAGYSTRGVVQPKGKATAHPKMGALKRTVWELRAAKVRHCCGEIAPHLDCA